MRSDDRVLFFEKFKALEERLDDIDNRLDTLFYYYCSSKSSSFEHKKLERTLDSIVKHIEEQTALEPGKELTDSSDSDSFEPYYVSSDEPTSLEKKICKVKCVNKKSANKKAKPRRNQRKRARAKVEMESERQAERIPERPSEKDLSNNLPSDLEELTKVFEKNLEGLENLVKLFKSDVSKMFDISDPNFPSRSINASPEK
ncbi:hypothetical protein RhiirC2_793431 [Rhizophagus irregularis]|uniref:Uncharacterized protein n=1 Tax=Rhizophagus irregularis TaxID=588596 RepID=A0A2N1MFE7_9GLOM|nr:hypothetical protein RhiirC2_793431 [Rhizophagus irregularis]